MSTYYYDYFRYIIFVCFADFLSRYIDLLSRLIKSIYWLFISTYWLNALRFHFPNCRINKSIYRDNKSTKWNYYFWFLIVVIISRYIEIMSGQNEIILLFLIVVIISRYIAIISRQNKTMLIITTILGT